MKIITDYRQWHSPNSSIGKLHLADNTEFGFTLCDTLRAWGIKIPKFTGIPVTTDFFYHVDVTYSTRFKKELPIIYTEIKDGRYLLKNGGIEFEAIRFHGLNDHTETDGCVGIAFAWDGKNKIYNPDKKNRADDALTKIIKDYLKTGVVGLRVVNLPNKL